jgi:hypothetical protein
MQIPDDTQVIDLSGLMPVPALMAHVATVLETNGSVYVRNATAPATGPGTCALHLGFRLAKAQSLPKTEEELNAPVG